MARELATTNGDAHRIELPLHLPPGLDREEVESLFEIAMSDPNSMARMRAKVALIETGVIAEEAFFPRAKMAPRKKQPPEAVVRGYSKDTIPLHGKLIMQSLSEVEPAEVDWLWPWRFPLGMLSLIYGDGGEGKSLLLLSIASAVTRGIEWPDQPGVFAPRGTVILVQAEDSLKYTVRPRFDSLDGDPERLKVIKGVNLPGGLRSSFSVRANIKALRDQVVEYGNVKLVVIDPISAFLAGVDDNKNVEVREALTPLAELAEELHFAVIMNHHTNKGVGTKALYRASGASYANVARISWFIGRDPDKPARSFMAPVKVNIAAMPSAMAFGIKGQSVEWDPEPVLGLHANMILMRERTLLAEDADGIRDGARGPLPARLHKCVTRLAEYLAAGPKPQRDARECAVAAGFSVGTYLEAVKRGPFRKIEPTKAGDLTLLELKDRLPLEFGEEDSPNVG